MLIQCVNGLLKSPKNGVISSAVSSKLLEEKNKETEQMWHSNGLLWQKKKEKNERTQQLFLEACRKWQFGWLLIFLFFWGGLFFHSSGSRVSNLLCVRLIAIIIERVPGWTGSDWSRWRLRRASTALGKGKVLPCLFAVCCVGTEEHPPTSELGAPLGQDSQAGLMSAPAAQASPQASRRSHSLLVEPWSVQQIKPTGTIL